MPEAFAKFRVGTPGAGAAHASYITRASALEPGKERSPEGQMELHERQSSVAAALEQDLQGQALEGTGRPDDADPVWTWNAPSHLTGDHYGIQEERSARALGNIAQLTPDLHDKMTSGISSQNRAQRLEEKVSKLRAYFGSMEQFEKAKGGRTHYRVSCRLTYQPRTRRFATLQTSS
ncbi:MAG: hypothetical protein DMF61_26680 [Blastocatellia bacterium AA13]|nr:MAG: hypothetical protein DMF61_26680 [Blastocatellia bacterium AA13]